MKNIKKLAFLLPILLGVTSLSSCNDTVEKVPTPDENENEKPDVDIEVPEKDNSITLEELVNDIYKNKNYTYTYEFTSVDEKGNSVLNYRYEDKFTNYGMYSKKIIDIMPEYNGVAYVVSALDGAIPVSIDENGVVTPGRAIRDINGNNIETYYDEIIALDDLSINDYEVSPFKKDNKFKIKNLLAQQTILEASQISHRKSKLTLEYISIDLNDKNSIEIYGDLGKNNTFKGTITNVGTTTIPELEKFINDKERAFSKEEADAPYQELIDLINNYNYKLPLFEYYGGDSATQVGYQKVYRKVLNDKTATVLFYDYDGVREDRGYIEIEQNNSYTLHNFKVQNDELILGDKVKDSENRLVSRFEDSLYLINQLRIFNEDKLLLDEAKDLENTKLYLTPDVLSSVNLCLYFGLGDSLRISNPLYAATRIYYNEDQTIDNVQLLYGWQLLDGTNDVTATIIDDFNKIELPFVDAYLGGM